MSTANEPFVSIITPVYNGEAYLRECIESVLAQTYSNWEYIIVNNCSTDGTLKIAEEYSRRDKRIQVHSNDTLLPIIANHNRAFRLISPESKYCKVVSGDDWVYPECIARMVALAEANPSVGLVGSYQLSGGGDRWYLRTYGLPYYSKVISGREIIRAHLLGTLDVLGDPTSSLYRADLVRRTDSFYPNSTAEADLSACYECLKDTDFGFVHQVLSYERLHPEQMSNTSKSLEAYFTSKIGDLRVYGSLFLEPADQEKRTNALMKEYYKSLADHAVHFRGGGFWSFQRRRLQEVGFSFSNVRLAKAISAKVLDLLLNPKETSGKLLKRLAPN
jgi:glycosyltransferase involved in cell wall biosynthesis